MNPYLLVFRCAKAVEYQESNYMCYGNLRLATANATLTLDANLTPIDLKSGFDQVSDVM